MRIVSLVPSWTETLIEAGAEVVGRTRFCIHPGERVCGIPVVGGTKDWDWPRILQLKPDLLILDQEENPKFMAEQTEIPFFATHVTSIKEMPGALRDIAERLANSPLRSLADRWQRLWTEGQARIASSANALPGLIEWGRPTQGPIDKVIYVIWRQPWMAVSRDTFIGSSLRFCGLNIDMYPVRYPVIDEAELKVPSTLVLLSSEPYPFLRMKDKLQEIESPYAFVNGESFSWFGLRSLLFLESVNSLQK